MPASRPDPSRSTGATSRPDPRPAAHRAADAADAARPGRPRHRRPPRPGALRAVLGLLVFLGATAIAAGIGGLAAAGSHETYAALRLPPFAPPAWLFGPAWTVLYVLIGVAAWLVQRRVGADRAIGLWVLQLVLNAAWTPLFFAAGLYWPAFAEIVVLWLAILACLVAFARRRPVAAVLLAPYLAWVTYAGALNLGIALLN